MKPFPEFKDSLLTVVSPVYHNQDSLKELCRQVFLAATPRFKSVEYIFVNDDFPDDSRKVLKELSESHPNVKVINLARNFGQHVALRVGLEHAKGDYVMMIDADLEETPDSLPMFLEKIKEGHEIVIGKRRKPRRGLLRSLMTNMYFKIFNFISDYKIIQDATTLRIMTRRYTDYLLKFPERPFIAGFVAWIGMPPALVEVPWTQRSRSSGYTFAKLLDHARVGLMGFSNKPIRFVFHVGLCVTLASIGLAIYYVARQILYGDVAVGFTFILTLFTFLMGVQFLFIGLLGEYIGEIFLAVKRRPDYLIYDKFNIN